MSLIAVRSFAFIDFFCISIVAMMLIGTALAGFRGGGGIFSKKKALIKQYQGKRWFLATPALSSAPSPSSVGNLNTRCGYMRLYSTTSSDYTDVLRNHFHHNASSPSPPSSLSITSDRQTELLAHLYANRNKLGEYWLQQLEKIRKPAAQRLFALHWEAALLMGGILAYVSVSLSKPY